MIYHTAQKFYKEVGKTSRNINKGSQSPYLSYRVVHLCHVNFEHIFLKASPKIIIKLFHTSKLSEILLKLVSANQKCEQCTKTTKERQFHHD